MLKRSIDKKSYDSLSDELKTYYTEKDGSYTLKVEGDDTTEDVGALKRAKSHEVEARKKAEKELKELKQQLADEDDDASRKKGDVAALEKSWQEKYNKLEQEKQTAVSNKDKFIEKMLIDGKATELAAKLSGERSSIMLPHVRSRLTVDTTGDAPVLKVLGADGNVSASTLEDLEKEFVANKDFSSILVASKAKGSGAPAGYVQQPFGRANVGSDGKPLKFTELSPKEQVARIKAKKEENTE